MARAAKNHKLDSRTARLKLETRKEPYRTSLEIGLSLYYYRRVKAGTWVVLHRLDGKRKEYKIGFADDLQESNGHDVLTFGEAQKAARKIRDDESQRAAGIELDCPKSFTINDAIDLYLKDRSHLKSLKDIEQRLKANVAPVLGEHKLYRLTEQQVKAWHKEIADRPAKVRPKLNGTSNTRKRQDPRARKATANRMLAYFKAVLNLAYEKKKVGSNQAWLHVKPFKNVESAKIDYFTHEESKRLLNSCDLDFKNLVKAALLTGARYGDLCAFRVCDFDPQNGSIFIRKPKNDKPRHIPLNQEGSHFFNQLSLGRKKSDFLLTRNDGEPWRDGHQTRRMLTACKNAQIEPAKSFHILRHTYATELVSRGVPLQFVSELLGHSDTAITHKHYAHLQPNALQDAVRQFLPEYENQENNVTELKTSAKSLQPIS